MVGPSSIASKKQMAAEHVNKSSNGSGLDSLINRETYICLNSTSKRIGASYRIGSKVQLNNRLNAAIAMVRFNRNRQIIEQRNRWI